MRARARRVRRIILASAVGLSVVLSTAMPRAEGIMRDNMTVRMQSPVFDRMETNNLKACAIVLRWASGEINKSQAAAQLKKVVSSKAIRDSILESTPKLSADEARRIGEFLIKYAAKTKMGKLRLFESRLSSILGRDMNEYWDEQTGIPGRVTLKKLKAYLKIREKGEGFKRQYNPQREYWARADVKRRIYRKA